MGTTRTLVEFGLLTALTASCASGGIESEDPAPTTISRAMQVGTAALIDVDQCSFIEPEVGGETVSLDELEEDQVAVLAYREERKYAKLFIIANGENVESAQTGAIAVEPRTEDRWDGTYWARIDATTQNIMVEPISTELVLELKNGDTVRIVGSVNNPTLEPFEPDDGDGAFATVSATCG